MLLLGLDAWHREKGAQTGSLSRPKSEVQCIFFLSLAQLCPFREFPMRWVYCRSTQGGALAHPRTPMLRNFPWMEACCFRVMVSVCTSVNIKSIDIGSVYNVTLYRPKYTRIWKISSVRACLDPSTNWHIACLGVCGDFGNIDNLFLIYRVGFAYVYS